jgi:hypothetical protein
MPVIDKFNLATTNAKALKDVKHRDYHYEQSNLHVLIELEKEAGYANEIEEYMDKHGCTYSKAYSDVLKSKKKGPKAESLSNERKRAISDIEKGGIR